MPTKRTTKKAKSALRSGKKASTAAGEFVREEFHHVRSGKHGAASKKQIVAIGLSKARKAGIKVPRKGKSAARRKMGRKRKSR